MEGNTMTKIEFLQALAKGWFGNSQQHSIQAQMLKQRGFGTVMLTCEWILGKYPVSRETLTEVYAVSLPEPLSVYFQ